MARMMLDDVIDWLITYATNHKIGVIATWDLSPTDPSAASDLPPIIAINFNWYDKNEIPFMISHEIGHAYAQNSIYYHASHLGIERGESEANIFAINLLLKYCKEHELYFSTIYEFAKNFSIPKKCYYLLDSICP